MISTPASFAAVSAPAWTLCQKKCEVPFGITAMTRLPPVVWRRQASPKIVNAVTTINRPTVSLVFIFPPGIKFRFFQPRSRYETQYRIPNNSLVEKPTQPRWGLRAFDQLTQGNREARQPWAPFLNRFAVIPNSFTCSDRSSFYHY